MISLRHGFEQFAVLGEHLARFLDDRRRQAAGDVLFERQHELGLRPIALDHDRQRLVDAAERAIDDLLADAARQRLGADAVEPVDE